MPDFVVTSFSGRLHCSIDYRGKLSKHNHESLGTEKLREKIREVDEGCSIDQLKSAYSEKISAIEQAMENERAS